MIVFSLQEWAKRAQLDLFRFVQERQGLGFTFDPDDLQSEVRERPIRALLAWPKRSVQMLRLTTHRLDDPEAEKLRRRYLSRRNLVLIAFFGGIAIPIYFWGYGGQLT